MFKKIDNYILNLYFIFCNEQILYYYLSFIYLEDKYVFKKEYSFYAKSKFYFYNMDY